MKHFSEIPVVVFFSQYNIQYLTFIIHLLWTHKSHIHETKLCVMSCFSLHSMTDVWEMQLSAPLLAGICFLPLWSVSPPPSPKHSYIECPFLWLSWLQGADSGWLTQTNSGSENWNQGKVGGMLNGWALSTQSYHNLSVLIIIEQL